MVDGFATTIPLGNLVDDVTVGHVGSMVAEYRSSGVPFLRSTNILPYRLDTADVVYIGRGFHERLRKSALRPGDLVVVRTGKPGTACVIPESLGEANCSDLVIVRPGKRADARFLAYFINGMAAGHVEAYAVGAVQQHFNIGEAKRLPVPALHVDDQRAIADVLGALDDKVELNRQMNHTLEEMASALFKSWFVDFDPIVAKADGRQPFGMDGATASLFPTTFADSDLGPIPSGWKATTVGGCVADVFDGPHATPPDAASGAVFLGIGNMTGTGIDLASVRFIAESDWARWTKRVTPREGDIVFTYEAALGRFALVPAGLRCCLGRRMALVRPRAPAHAPFLFHQCVAAPFQEVVSARSWTGSTVDRTPLTEFPAYPFLWPGDALVARFSEQAAPMWALIHDNQAESRTLTALRDTLLPKLLSGEVRLKQAEKLVEAAL